MKKQFTFAGHAIGAAAQFHRLDDFEGLNHIIPTQGASVLPATGGFSKSQVSDYRYDVDLPRKRTLLSVKRVETVAEGKPVGTECYQTEIGAEIESICVVEKLSIDFVKIHLLSTRDASKEDPAVSTKGNRIEGVRLLNVEAKIVLDEEPLLFSASKQQLADFYKRQTAEYKLANSWRFNTAPDKHEIAPCGKAYKYSLVSGITLEGSERDKQDITVDGYTIIWKGFGRIILGEVIVKDQDRRLTMARLAMGSDAGGDGSVGDGQTNGMVGT